MAPEIAPQMYASAVVTGATSGIGRAIAIRLRDHGLEVTAIGRNEDRLRELATEYGMRTVAADIRDTGRLATLLGQHPCDVLVSNAGILPTTAPFQEIDPSDIDAIIETNLTATLKLARYLLPAMVRNSRGHLFFIGSSAGRWPHPNMAVYGAAKAAISLFCDCLRCDLAGTGVRVSEICPGRVETNLYLDAFGQEGRDELYAGKEPIRPADIASLLVTMLQMPMHVDVSRAEVFPTTQTVGGSKIVPVGRRD